MGVPSSPGYVVTARPGVGRASPGAKLPGRIQVLSTFLQIPSPCQALRLLATVSQVVAVRIIESALFCLIRPLAQSRNEGKTRSADVCPDQSQSQARDCTCPVHRYCWPFEIVDQRAESTAR